MRTNIEIDDALMAEAMAATGYKTKRETVEAGLRLLTRRKRQASMRELFGAVEIGWTTRTRHRGEGGLRRQLRLD